MEFADPPTASADPWRSAGRILPVALPGVLLWAWDIATDLFFYGRTADPLLGTETTGIGAWGGLWWTFALLLALALWHAARVPRSPAPPPSYWPAVGVLALFSTWSILLSALEAATL